MPSINLKIYFVIRFVFCEPDTECAKPKCKITNAIGRVYYDILDTYDRLPLLKRKINYTCITIFLYVM